MVTPKNAMVTPKSANFDCCSQKIGPLGATIALTSVLTVQW